MKQKTNKAASKRFSQTSTGKIKHRPTHQSHFNGKDTGHETRRKHKSLVIDKSDEPRVHRLLPNKF